MERIETDRLIIRRFKESDWKDLYEYLSDSDVVRFEPYDVYNEKESMQEAVNRAKNPIFWAVCIKETGKLIGNLSFQKQDFDTWELGYVFNRKFQKKGFATEAAKALIGYSIKELNARRIIAMCSPENEASWNLLERLKMRREGHLLQNVYFKTDENNKPIWLDTYEYGVLTSEWSF